MNETTKKRVDFGNILIAMAGVVFVLYGLACIASCVL